MFSSTHIDANESRNDMTNTKTSYTIIVNNFFYTMIEATSTRDACLLAIEYVRQSKDAGEFAESTTRVDVVAYDSDPNQCCTRTVDFISGKVS